ncbi:MAG TPA: SufD family Fe-S cluster assembly protein [Bacteroidales bacterium]|jgi:Fe-S cluster assembly protein SufD|nr:SufD family Fe-S cluster assembly protein [Bacteroidales bacterium]MCZ2416666.1 SufD family Fe-S cluster assembly protein [Burkholderiales bacterium]OQC57481.1 MAG: FeS cluster assembly protein SufD [Bacteroidetes bacterium ADurb.Bin013]MBP8999226.1 SufD family Fe-S cluster assembly protein [Bacteroidales bacterium]MBV6455452.1 FeS cluster assembly protein SufD [Bacteroidales bacterium]
MTQYTYMPEVRHVFRCTVPDGNIRQVFLVDGVLQELENDVKGVVLEKGPDQMGLRMHISGDHSDEPIQIISVRSEDLPEPLEFSNYWELAAGASAQVIVCDHTLHEHLFRTFRFSYIKLGQGARLDILFMQNEHEKSRYWLDLKADLGRDSQLDCHILSLFGGTIYNKLYVSMPETGAACYLDGLYLADREQEIHYDISVRHESQGCQSRQLFKGILDNQARGSFNGSIYVAPGAQKTEAYQANHNLLLTRQAKITTKPQLEIYADDVKCSHGATIGRLDELGLFYLRSRGISLAEAQMIQQMAFVQDVLDRVRTSSIRSRLEKMVESRLRGEFTRCSHCTMHCC